MKVLIDTILYIPLFMMFIGIMAGTLFSMLRFQAEATSKMTSHALAGSISAVGSAPQTAVYCLEVPGGTQKVAYLRNIAVGTKSATSVLVSSDKGNFRTDIPLKSTDFSDLNITLPENSKHVIRITKRTLPQALASGHKLLEVERLEEDIENAQCEGLPV